MLNFYEIIDKKKNGLKLTEAEIAFFIKGVCDNSAPDYQVAALLMAIRLMGMDAEETYNLTLSIARSGAVTDLSGVNGVCADKHSTGGVSDATTLIVAPVLAALGIKVAKLSGRGLGHTGGTLDKLECFEGYNVSQSRESFIRIVNGVGAAICGQTGETAPADKKLYALRDVTATVDSIPLIASSVMGKKLASGAEIIVLDVKYGGGAFMKTLAGARKLARAMADIGLRAGKKTAAVITSMAQPLGNNIGGNLEVAGAIEVLRGAENDLARVSRVLAEKIYTLALKHKKNDITPVSAAERLRARREVGACIKDGRALNKLKEIVEAHGGRYTETFEKAAHIYCVPAPEEGFITAIDAERLGLINVALGGGRIKKDDVIDHRAGLVLHARLNNYVKKGDTLIEIHAGDPVKLKAAAKEAAAAFIVGAAKIKPPRLIVEV